MKKKRKVKIIKIRQYSDQCYLHNQIAEFARNLNRIPDAAEVRKEKTRSAPVTTLDMVF